VTPIEYVEALARALDEDDYETAAEMMSDRVDYRIGVESIRGPDAVVASYRAASEMAHRLFDQVAYDHRVVPTDDPHVFRVSYSDILTLNGETMTHQAEQHVTLDPNQGVIGIVNIELPGERERVDAFLARHGKSRRT
jgi:hypothetical protein